MYGPELFRNWENVIEGKTNTNSKLKTSFNLNFMMPLGFRCIEHTDRHTNPMAALLSGYYDRLEKTNDISRKITQSQRFVF